jgi:membrane protein YdbS with pleckstrin-like domain
MDWSTFEVISLARSCARDGERCKPGMEATEPERIRVHERRHGVVLVGSFARAFALAGPGLLALVIGWPATAIGALLLAVAAFVVLRAVWRWDRTRVVLTSEKLFVVHGTLRRRAAAVRLARVGPVEIEQSLLGRLLGYGTIIAGDLEITHVPRPQHLVDRLSS